MLWNGVLNHQLQSLVKYWLTGFEIAFQKEPWKKKPQLKVPKRCRDFGDFLRFFEPIWVPPIWQEYLNYSNITRKRFWILKIPCVLKIFSKPRAHKNSPATGVRNFLVGTGTWENSLFFSANLLGPILSFFLSLVWKTQANHWTKLMMSTRLTTLIKRNPPPRGGFLFAMFPHQEPCVRGPPSKDLYQVLGGGSSYTRFFVREHSK